MKRYQCIKHYYIIDDLCYTAGNLYNFHNIDNTDLIGCVDNLGITRIVDEELREHFQELLDLNVDEPDKERDQYVMQESRGCSGMFWAFIITAVVITLYAIFG